MFKSNHERHRGTEIIHFTVSVRALYLSASVVILFRGSERIVRREKLPFSLRRTQSFPGGCTCRVGRINSEKGEGTAEREQTDTNVRLRRDTRFKTAIRVIGGWTQRDLKERKAFGACYRMNGELRL